MSLTEPTFAELLTAAVAGDAASLNRLLGQYRALLRRAAAANLTGQHSLGIDPSDVVQETLLNIATSITRFRGSTSGEFEAWLRSMVQNKVIDAVRRRTAGKRNVEREQPLDDGGGPTDAHRVASGELSPRTHAIRRERLQIALQSIVAENQAVLRPYLLEGVPVATIAEQLALPLAETARRLECGLRTLKRRLTADDSDSSQDEPTDDASRV